MNVRHSRLAAVVLVALGLAACGNPNGPSEGVTLEATVVGSGFSAASLRGSSASAAVITVTVVENPAMTTTVGADGRFTMRGLPEGGFTLLFRIDGVDAGSIHFDQVLPNQEITITISVAGSSVTLLEERRNGIGHGDFEIEGRVDQVLVVSTTGDSRFVIDGRTVIARPGQTTIREGNRARVPAEVTMGRRVHVKGVWLAAVPPAPQEALAWEIMLQGDEIGPSPAPGATCMINGGRAGDGIELEGRVSSGALPTFMMTVNGNRATGPVSIEAASASIECSPASGPNAPTPAACQARVTSGQRVHVRGTLTSCSLTAAVVSATSVRVQN
jgi:hypothetical protein